MVARGLSSEWWRKRTNGSARLSARGRRQGADLRGPGGPDSPGDRRRHRQGDPPVRPAGDRGNRDRSRRGNARRAAQARAGRPSRPSGPRSRICRPGSRLRAGLRGGGAALDGPGARWSRMAALLEPGGVFASFGGPVQLADPAVVEAVHAARAPFLDTDEIPSPDGTPAGHAMQWPGTELQQSAWFADVRQSMIERRFTMAPGTTSAISRPSRRTCSCRPRPEGVRRDPAGPAETVEVAGDIVIHLARRRPPARASRARDRPR